MEKRRAALRVLGVLIGVGVLVGACSSSTSNGTVRPAICASDEDCAKPEDPCNTSTCDGATAVCVLGVLDNDGDGFAPLVCGGKDCNDANAVIGPHQMETCDGVDDDCNGAIDDDAPCGGEFQVCVAGACVCSSENRCGRDCVDKSISPFHCGACNNRCAEGMACTDGVCDPCPKGTKLCSEATGCTDVQGDASNCGACGTRCPSIQTCSGGECVCPDGKTACGEECLDTGLDVHNCGACGAECPASAGFVCQAGECSCDGQGSCSACDVALQPTAPLIDDFSAANGQFGSSGTGLSGGVVAQGLTSSFAGQQLSLTGTVTNTPSATLYFNTGCADLNQYRGIAFTVSGTAGPSGQMSVYAGTAENTAPTADGAGTCLAATCYGPSARFDVGQAPTKIAILWDDMNGGTPVPGVNAAQITGFSWVFDWKSGQTPYPVTVTFDDVMLVE